VSKTRGLVAAVLGYVCWGPLAPLGVLLLRDTGPFTLNTWRTVGSLVLFTATWGPSALVRSIRILGRDWRPWLLGTIGIGFTFSAYLGSLLYLEPTIGALTIYLSPVLIAWFAPRFLGEKNPRLALTTVLLTLAGGALAVLEPSKGVHVPNGVLFGLFLGVSGAFGWTFYSLQLRHLGTRYSDEELTLTTFLTSGLVFLVFALPLEHLQFHAGRLSLVRLAVYIVMPSYLAFRLYAVAIRQAGASVTAVLLGIELVATAVFSYFLTDETFSLDKIAGVAIVIAAVTAFMVLEARSGAPTAQANAHGQQEGP
jgi:drug/metabolite transporter (DMT)-like permease